MDHRSTSLILRSTTRLILFPTNVTHLNYSSLLAIYVIFNNPISCLNDNRKF